MLRELHFLPLAAGRLSINNEGGYQIVRVSFGNA